MKHTNTIMTNKIAIKSELFEESLPLDVCASISGCIVDVSSLLGCAVGFEVRGVRDGLCEGKMEGLCEGCGVVGVREGTYEGRVDVGSVVGKVEGAKLGETEGKPLGVVDGEAVATIISIFWSTKCTPSAEAQSEYVPIEFNVIGKGM